MEVAFIVLLLSIGISDAIELWFNPEVHKIHNCPDILNMKFENYDYHHAFLSGIMCSWFLFLTALIIANVIEWYTERKLNTNILFILSFINIMMPFFVNPSTCTDIFMCHKMLYLINFIGIIYFFTTNKIK